MRDVAAAEAVSVGEADLVDEADWHQPLRVQRCERPVDVSPFEDGSLFAKCKTRFAARCEHCADQYRQHIVRLGSSGIDGQPDNTRFFWVTMTAPGYGPVHAVPEAGEAPVRCGCGKIHDVESDGDLMGVPLDPMTYCYDLQAEFNAHVDKLLADFRRRLQKADPNAAYFYIWDLQARGALHIHMLVRVPDATPLTPKTVPLTLKALNAVIRDTKTPGPRRTTLGFGDDSDVQDLAEHAARELGTQDAEEIAQRTRELAIIEVKYMARALTRLTPEWPGRARDHGENLAAAARTTPCAAPSCTAEQICTGRHHSQCGARRKPAGRSTDWCAEGLTMAALYQEQREWAIQQAAVAEPPEPLRPAPECTAERFGLLDGAAAAQPGPPAWKLEPLPGVRSRAGIRVAAGRERDLVRGRPIDRAHVRAIPPHPKPPLRKRRACRWAAGYPP